jgi:chemotaxis signal transduction protein
MSKCFHKREFSEIISGKKTSLNLTFDAAVQELPPTALPMTPTQALTTKFAIVSTGEIELTKQNTNLSKGVSGIVTGDSRQGFRIGELYLMIRYDEGSELSEIPSIHKLPNTPDWFRGIANLHGKLIPVFDLAHYFGIEADSQAKRMLLVLSRGIDATGIVIDGLPQRLRIGTDSLAQDAPLMTSLEGVVSGTYWVGERSWLSLQVDALLDRLEQELVAAN